MGLDVPAHYPFVIEGSIKFVSVAFFSFPHRSVSPKVPMPFCLAPSAWRPRGGVSLAFIRRLRTLAVAAVGLVALALLSAGPVRW